MQTYMAYEENSLLNMCSVAITGEMEAHDVTLDDMISVVKENTYVKDCRSNKSRDYNSISYLIERTISQSDSIKIGNAVEKVLRDTVLRFTSCRVVKRRNTKGKKEKDILLMDNVNKVIYYTEIKTNLNLDTEKSKSTYEKCLAIRDEIQDIIDTHDPLSEYTLKWCLLGARYLDYSDIPPTIAKKYDAIKDHVFGVNQFLNMVGVKFEFIMDDYMVYLNSMVDLMFDEEDRA